MMFASTGYCALHHVDRFQVRDLYEKRKTFSEQEKTDKEI